MCRSRRELSNAYSLAKFGFDTAENEPSKVWPIKRYSGNPYIASRPSALEQEGPQRVRLRALEEGAAEPLRQRRDRRLAARDVRLCFFLTPS